jgi:hypothetical protein
MIIKILTLVIAALMLSSCTASSFKVSYDQLYQGYPCQDNCLGFQSGYEIARDQNFKEENACQNLPKINRLGCLSYMHEYHLIHDQPEGYNF